MHIFPNIDVPRLTLSPIPLFIYISRRDGPPPNPPTTHQALYYGKEGYNVMAMDLLGPSLEDLFQRSHSEQTRYWRGRTPCTWRPPPGFHGAHLSSIWSPSCSTVFRERYIP